jgi:hypothetical protein
VTGDPPLQQIGGVERIKLVDLHVAADLNVPVETLLEDPITQAVHLGEIVGELAIEIMCDELHHDRLLGTMVSRNWRRTAVSTHPVQLHRSTGGVS